MSDIDNEQMSPTNAVTEDMKLPPGSAVIQAILHQDGEEGHIDFRFVAIGAQVLDPLNPAHRFMVAVKNRMPEIMTEINGAPGGEEDVDVIEDRLRAAQAAIQGEAFVKALVEKGKTPEEAERLLAIAKAGESNLAPEGQPPATNEFVAPGCEQFHETQDLSVFKVTALADTSQEDTVYIAAGTRERARDLLVASYGEMPDSLLQWEEVPLPSGRPVTEGILEGYGE